ncbi:MAG TPA: hypothetical protein VGI10_30370 [Polyangiaceae bacterium]
MHSRLFDELLSVAARAGLAVRSRAFRGGPFAGGLCTVQGTRMVLLNSHASLVDRSVALADALRAAGLMEVEMSAEAKRFMGSRSRSKSGVVEPDEAPRPGLAKAATAHKKKPHSR